MENLPFSQGFPTVSTHPLWIFPLLFHRLWKTVWKKEVLHRQELKSLCKSPKSPCFCEKSPFFDTHAPVGCVDKLSTALWKSGRTGFYPQAPMDKRKNTGGILHRKNCRSYPQRRLWHSRDVKKFRKTVPLSPLLRLSTKYPPRMQSFSTENFGGSEKNCLSYMKNPVFHSFHGLYCYRYWSSLVKSCLLRL